MTFHDVAKMSCNQLLPIISELYGLRGYEMTLIEPHDGGRNDIYACHQEGTDARIIRISYLRDRSREDFLSELDFIRYLSEHDGKVANVISSEPFQHVARNM